VCTRVSSDTLLLLNLLLLNLWLNSAISVCSNEDDSRKDDTIVATEAETEEDDAHI